MASEPTSPQTLLERVKSSPNRLTPTDERLLEVLLDDPMRAAMDNGAAISSRAGVHPASAVRFARRLGFAGYPELRSFIQQSLVKGEGDFESPAARMAARLARAPSGGLLDTVIDSEIAALRQMRRSVSDQDITHFAQRLRDCRRIFVFGRGHAATLSSLISLRLIRSGYDAVDLGARMHQMPEALNDISGQDVVWLLGFRKTPALLGEIQAITSHRGALTLAITDRQAGHFPSSIDRHIIVSRGAAGESQSLVVPMTIANTIILELAAIDGGRSIRALEAFKAFRADGKLSTALL
jgi:DNA-binding MurR/RpiR family transcriptional regulator